MFVSVLFAAYVQIALKVLGEQRFPAESLVRKIVLCPTHLESLVAYVFVSACENVLRCCVRQVPAPF